MSGVQSPRARADRAVAGCGRIDQGSRAKIRDRLSRLASALAEPCVGGSPRRVHRGRRRDQRPARRDRGGRISRADRQLPHRPRSALQRVCRRLGGGDGNSLAFLAGRLHENFRDCGRLTGELQRGPLLNIQNNVLINPDYTRAITRIVSAVAPYPEAREAVIAALRDLDTASASTPALTDRRNEGAAIDG